MLKCAYHMQIMPQAEAKKTNLPGSDPTKNAKALLRDALPISNQPIRAIQVQMLDTELIPEASSTCYLAMNGVRFRAERAGEHLGSTADSRQQVPGSHRTVCAQERKHPQGQKGGYHQGLCSRQKGAGIQLIFSLVTHGVSAGLAQTGIQHWSGQGEMLS